MGSFVTERFAYDGGREVTVFVPDRAPSAIVVAADGQLTAPWGADLEAAGLPPVLVVGVHRSDDETQRLHEYSPAFDPDRFAAHERFVVDDVLPWVRGRFGVDVRPARTAAFGVSAGGEWALALGLRHPQLIGAVFCASPGGGYRPPGPMPEALPRTYLVAGTREPFFLANADRWADALRQAGANVVTAERDAGHDDTMWREEFPRMVGWWSGV